MSESCRVVYFSLRLDSDLEIRIQKKLCSYPTTSFAVLQSQLINKAVCNSPLEVEPKVLILASDGVSRLGLGLETRFLESRSGSRRSQVSSRYRRISA